MTLEGNCTTISNHQQQQQQHPHHHHHHNHHNNTTTSVDDMDMFGPPRSTLPMGYYQRSRVPMISPKLRQREERKRILQLCATKLEGIKDSDTNLRRSVCINNTYSRLTDELRREKQCRYLANLPTSDNKTDKKKKQESKKETKRTSSLSNVEKDLEILDREIRAINASMPLIDPEITQGAEQLERALSSRKRRHSEDESDQLVREALAQFYLPQERLISAIEDLPLDFKRQKLQNDTNNNQSEQKDFDCIMDALRLGAQSSPPSPSSDSCGQAAMISEAGGALFHNLVVTSLET